MGRFKGNDATRGLKGNVGDFYNYRQHLGQTITTRQVGKRTKPLKDSQQQTKERFIEATLYAKAVMKNDVKKAIYEAKVVPGAGVYLLAVTDYLKPPVVKKINVEAYTGQPGSVIKIRAFDDFSVTRVHAAIFNAAGNVLEEGDTVLDPENGLDYIYTSTVVNDLPAGSTIKAIAFDLAGNRGSLEMII